MSSSKPSPSLLYKQADNDDAYRVAMLEHGYTVPSAPWQRKASGKRVIQCGLTHEENWSPWQVFTHGTRRYEGRWCRTCATTQARPSEASERSGTTAVPACLRCGTMMVWRHSSWQCPKCTYKEGCCG